MCKVRPYRHKLQGDIVEAVGQEVLSDPEYRAVAGWRVHEWDGERVRFEPYWWLAKPDAEAGWTWWDVQADSGEYDYIMDHDLCIARILELEQRQQVRPCDIVYKDNNWYLDANNGLVWIPELTTKLILSESRPSRVNFVISQGPQGIVFNSGSVTGAFTGLFPQVTTSTAGSTK